MNKQQIINEIKRDYLKLKNKAHKYRSIPTYLINDLKDLKIYALSKGIDFEKIVAEVNGKTPKRQQEGNTKNGSHKWPGVY